MDKRHIKIEVGVPDTSAAKELLDDLEALKDKYEVSVSIYINYQKFEWIATP